MASNASEEKPMLALASPVFPPKGVYAYFSRRSPSASVSARARDIGDDAEAVL